MSNFRFFDKFPRRTPRKAVEDSEAAAVSSKNRKVKPSVVRVARGFIVRKTRFTGSQQLVRNLLSGIQAVQQRTAEIKDNHFQFQSGRNFAGGRFLRQR
jgi:hypothetical protein